MIRQSEQEDRFCIELEIGKENCQTIVFKTEEDGWPSLECQEEMVVFGVGEAKKELIFGDGMRHS